MHTCAQYGVIFFLKVIGKGVNNKNKQAQTNLTLAGNQIAGQLSPRITPYGSI
jgi:hypothetical protein